MSTTQETEKAQDEIEMLEAEKIREQILALKVEIKDKASKQRTDKQELHKDHRTLPDVSSLMTRVSHRAWVISNAHIEYNKLRGKPWNMHVSTQ